MAEYLPAQECDLDHLPEKLLRSAAEDRSAYYSQMDVIDENKRRSVFKYKAGMIGIIAFIIITTIAAVLLWINCWAEPYFAFAGKPGIIAVLVIGVTVISLIVRTFRLAHKNDG